MQQVNLFLEEFKKIEPPYSAAIILLLMGYTLFFSFVVTGGLYALTVKERAVHTDLLEQTRFWQEQFDIAYQQNPEPKISEALLKSIEGYERQITRNMNVLGYLSGRRNVVRKQVFSIYLDALTKIKQDDLWLTKIAIKKGGTSLTLHGRVLNPSGLPEYIRKISELDIFKTMQFEVFDLKRDGDQMKFVVSSEKQEMSIEDYLDKATTKN
ncbi:hypothetical protein ACU6U9_05295 [Pseudomonas sp. HK3]|jgi:hypothetical protein